jgi:hypothetical protein
VREVQYKQTLSGFHNMKRQTTNDKRQTTNDKRQTTNDKRQTTNDKRQTTIKYINWINKNKNNYKDLSTDEYNLTGIAESLAEEFDLYVDEWNCEIPDSVFKIVSNTLA